MIEEKLKKQKSPAVVKYKYMVLMLGITLKEIYFKKNKIVLFYKYH